MFEINDYVNNVLAKNWGAGRVLSVGFDKIEIEFENVGLKILKLSISKIEKIDDVKGIKFKKISNKITCTQNLVEELARKSPGKRFLDDYNIDKLKIYLKSNNSKMIFGEYVCDQCCVSCENIHVFSKSNIGKVYICSRCKPTLLEVSFGKEDALNHAVRGGKFDSSRNKH